MTEMELEEEDATFEEAFVAHVFGSITWLIYKQANNNKLQDKMEGVTCSIESW